MIKLNNILNEVIQEGGAGGHRNLVNENNGTVCCVICNKWFGQITKNHLKFKHNISLEEYVQKYNVPTIAESKKNIGDKNPMKTYLNKNKWEKIIKSEEHKQKQRTISLNHISSLSEEEKKKYNGWKNDNIDKDNFRKKVSVGVKKSYENTELRVLRSNTIGLIGKKNLLERYNEKIKMGEWISPENKTDYIGYRDRVRKLTDENFQKQFLNIKNSKLRGNGWDLDHKISIHYGFKNHIPEEHISHIKNLEMLPSKINYKKGSNCSMSYESLLESIEKENYDKNI
jgi:uncharacterized Zn finger protein (UPF0148 family)